MNTNIELTLKAFTSPENVREYCIRNGFYTCGTNESYMELLDYVRSHRYMNTITLSVIIGDIIKHSDINVDDYGIDMDDVKTEITNDFLSTACKIVVGR